jgi:hypothetical protein
MKNFNFSFVDYMKGLAFKNRLLQHTDEKKAFYRVSSITNLEELLTSGSFGKNRCMLVIDGREGRMVDNESDNLLDNQYYTFFIVEHVEQNDPDKRQQALVMCMYVVKQVLGKMFLDKRNDQKGKTPLTGLGNLDRASIYYKEFGPIGDNFWGYMVSFSLMEPPNIRYNEQDWID